MNIRLQEKGLGLVDFAWICDQVIYDGIGTLKDANTFLYGDSSG